MAKRPPGKTTAVSKSWRNHYPPHPCADVFPMMSEPELEELTKDIKVHGQQQPVILWQDPSTPEDSEHYFVLDGRNRLEAMERLERATGKEQSVRDFVLRIPDPASYVISANIRRRHLTKAEQADLIMKTIAASQETGRNNDRLILSQSKNGRLFSPTNGKRGGSTKDPLLEAAVIEAAKHGISRATVKRARTKLGISARPPKKKGRSTERAPKRPTWQHDLQMAVDHARTIASVDAIRAFILACLAKEEVTS